MGFVIRNVTFGNGVLVCAPVTAKNEEGICCDVKEIMNNPVDLIEWRCDSYAFGQNADRVVETLGIIRNITDMPVVFTYRTKSEGGEEGLSDVITKSEYVSLIKKVADTGSADLIDVQTEYLGSMAYELIEYIKKKNVRNKPYITFSQEAGLTLTA